MTFDPVLWALPVATLCLALGWRPWRSGPEPSGGRWGSALALPLTAFAGWWSLHGELVPLPPKEAQHWSLWAALVAALVAAVPPGRRGSLLARVAAVAALGFFALRGALSPYFEHHWEGDEWRVPLALSMGILLAVFLGQCALVRRRGTGAGLAWVLQLTTVAAAGVLGQSFAVGALVLGGVTTAVGGIWVLGLWRRERTHAAGSEAAWTFLVGGLLFTGVYFAETPRASALLVLAMPHAAWLPARTWRGTTARTVVALGLAGLALWLAWPEPDPYGAYGG